jgi:hypothetical protein
MGKAQWRVGVRGVLLGKRASSIICDQNSGKKLVDVLV